MTIALPNPTLVAPRDDDDIVFDEVGKHHWRVLDTRVPSESLAALIGFVTLIASVYEVTNLARPRDISFCHDLSAAHASFLGRRDGTE